MIRKHTNRFTNPRLLAAMDDPRVTGIEEAVRRCKASGARRENLIHHRYQWPKFYAALLDELVLAGATTEDVMAVGDAFRDAAYVTVLVGNALPQESVADALARECVVEGEANRDAMKLVENPTDPSRLRSLARSLGTERDVTEATRRRVVAEIHVQEQRRAAERQRA